MQGADGWQLSTSTILSMACHSAAYEITNEAGIENLRKKSIKLTEYLRFILEEFNQKSGNISGYNYPKKFRRIRLSTFHFSREKW